MFVLFLRHSKFYLTEIRREQQWRQACLGWKKLAFALFKKTIKHFALFPKLIKEMPLF